MIGAGNEVADDGQMDSDLPVVQVTICCRRDAAEESAAGAQASSDSSNNSSDGVPTAGSDVKLVPAHVLDDARQMIRLLMEEVDVLQQALLEARSGASPPNGRQEYGDGDSSPSHASTPPLPVSQAQQQQRLQEEKAARLTTRTSDHEWIGDGDKDHATIIASLKRTIQQRNRAMHHVQQQLTETKASNAALQLEVAAKDADIEKHKRREQVLAKDMENLKKELALKKSQLASMRTVQSETLAFFTNTLLQLKRSEEAEGEGFSIVSCAEGE